MKPHCQQFATQEQRRLYTKKPLAAAAEKVLLDLGNSSDIRPVQDGRYLLYKFGSNPGDLCVAVVREQAYTRRQSPRFSRQARFSPDGRGSLTTATIPEEWSVCGSFSARITGLRSPTGHFKPRWLMAKCFYLAPDGTMMSVEISGPSEPIPKALFQPVCSWTHPSISTPSRPTDAPHAGASTSAQHPSVSFELASGRLTACGRTARISSVPFSPFDKCVQQMNSCAFAAAQYPIIAANFLYILGFPMAKTFATCWLFCLRSTGRN
jgi:hypothetical protein